MTKASLYPANPAGVPEHLTASSALYKTQTVLLLLLLGLSFLAYFALMVVCVVLPLWAIFLCPEEADPETGIPWPAFKLSALLLTLPCAALSFYMLRNLFRGERVAKEFLVEIHEEDYPRLFDFIQQVCRDVGTQPPAHVYVDYAVNAYVMADVKSILQLLVRGDKGLVIGLGLVNSVNLTEFKALLAHEFGHFAQTGMLIGPFTHKLRHLSYHLVYGANVRRPADGWARHDAHAAWGPGLLRALLWLPRQMVAFMWGIIGFCEGGLSRQMEFNADLMAVRLTGSDAPVHLLYRAHFGGLLFHQAVNDLGVALQAHLYTSDLFYHQSAAERQVRAQNKDARMGQPPELPADPRATSQVFDADAKDAEWTTHPSCHAREQNAKAHYVRSNFNERSAWLLFDNVEALRKQITHKFYRWHFKLPKDVPLADPAAVQGFIDDEYADRAYDPKYHGLYDNRSLFLSDIATLARRCAKHPWTVAELVQAHAALYDTEVKERSALYYQRVEEFQFLNAVRNGWQHSANAEIEFRGYIYDCDEVPQILRKVARELDKDKQWLGRTDRRVFMIYFQMAFHSDRTVATDLFRRYEFHLRLQDIWCELEKLNPLLQAAIEFLNAQHFGNVPAPQFRELLQILREVRAKMQAILASADRLTLPALKNLPPGESLRPLLLEKKLLAALSKSERHIRERWLIRLLNQFNEMKAKTGRVHFKSLAGILALQERIGDEYVRRAGQPTAL